MPVSSTILINHQNNLNRSSTVLEPVYLKQGF